jgi:mRNA interferase MazF
VIRRGEIYNVHFGPMTGSEVAKTRPALVISNDANNEFANTVTVLPISSKVHRVYPFEVEISKGQGGIPENSKIMTHHIRTIDKRRFRALPLGPTLDRSLMKRIEDALKEHLALPEN